MSANLGELEAQRILRARQTDADRATQQAIGQRILDTEQPRFFSAMTDQLAEYVNAFNQSMALEGEDAITFTCSTNEIYVGKKSKPFLLRKVMHFEHRNEVIVRTQVINGYQNNVDEQHWYFEVQRGELRLNCNNFVECAELLFKGIPDVFR